MPTRSEINNILNQHQLNVYGRGGTPGDLSGVDLSGMEISGPRSVRNLTGINLSGANLAGANLSNAILAGADLSSANLSGTNFTDANLTEANLVGANFIDATPRDGVNLTDAILVEAPPTLGINPYKNSFSLNFPNGTGDIDHLFFSNDDPPGFIEFFDGDFSALLLASMISSPSTISADQFVRLVLPNYASGNSSVDQQTEESWKDLLDAYIGDLNTALFTPRSAASYFSPGASVLAPTQTLGLLLEKATGSREAAQISRKFTNSIFLAIAPQILLAGLAFPGKPVFIAPYIPI